MTIKFAKASGFFAITAAAAGLVPASASAQQPPVFTWTGFYVGANIGLALHDNKTIAPPIAFGPAVFSQDSSGAFGGVNAGYNWQMNSLVVGVEVDGGLASASKSSTFFSGMFGANGTYSTKLNGAATARLRLGIAFDRALLYVTGGIAGADVGSRTRATSFTTFDFNQSDWRLGWAVGIGGEYALNQNWSVKLEAVHLMLNNRSTVFASPLGPYRFSFRDNATLVRTGFNYRF